MRTIEEVREWAQNRLDTLSRYPFCEACLNALISFIDSPPPCKHPSRTIYIRVPDGAVTYPIPTPAKFCPDCGERLIPGQTGGV